MSAVPHHVSAIATLPAPFVLESGAVLPELHLAYESYGKLSPNRDNVILVCHALTGSAAAGVGPDKVAGAARKNQRTANCKACCTDVTNV